MSKIVHVLLFSLLLRSTKFCAPDCVKFVLLGPAPSSLCFGSLLVMNQLTLPRCCSIAVGHHGDDGGAGIPPLEVLEAGLDHARRLVLSHHAVSAILEEKAIFECRKTRT